MPAAAVIPALLALHSIVAAKKFVVEVPGRSLNRWAPVSQISVARRGFLLRQGVVSSADGPPLGPLFSSQAAVCVDSYPRRAAS